MVKSWLSLGERFNVMPPEQLVAAFRPFHWRRSFYKLARIAALIDRYGADSKTVKDRTNSIITNYSCRNSSETLVAEYVRLHPDNPILHEQVIYYLQTLAILEGAEEGPEPPDAWIVFHALAANDYVHSWQQPDARPLTDLERVVGDFALVTRFNHSKDELRFFARAASLLKGPPPHGALKDTWEDFQKLAYGMDFTTFEETLIGPLALMSSSWGTVQTDGSIESPHVNTSEWFKQTNVPPDFGWQFFKSISVTRAEAKAELSKQRRPDGLPHAPTLFFRKPFVVLDDTTIVAASPTVAQQQFSMGLWALCLQASKNRRPKDGHTLWFETFGYLVDDWCREVAKEAEKGDFIGKVLLSKGIGTNDEIEDVIAQTSTDTALFSVKSATIPEKSVKQAQTRTDALDWYERFLFAPKTKDYRGGAIRLLNEKIDKIRSGKYDSIPKDHRIFPIIVTFDDLGENLPFYKWIEERCQQENLLQQDNVVPPSIASLAEYEALFGLAYHGISLFEVLGQRRELAMRYATMKELMVPHTKERQQQRLPYLQSKFDDVYKRIKHRLFGW